VLGAKLSKCRKAGRSSPLFDQVGVRPRKIFVTTWTYSIKAVIVEYDRTTVFPAFTRLHNTNYINGC
jgi:hypothetical protein